MGSFTEKMKNTYCFEHHSKQLLLNNAFQNIPGFQAICVLKLTQPPNNVTHDAKTIMDRYQINF